MDDSNENFNIRTAYNSLFLAYGQGRLELRGRDKSLQTVINLESPHKLEMPNLHYLLSVLMFAPAPARILLLGTAAGALVHFLRHHYPRATIEAVDIDGELIEKMLEMQILPEAGDHLSYITDDAARYIAQCDREFDLVLVDLFTGVQSPPWILDRTSIQQLYHRTAPGGALAYNLLVDSEHDLGHFYRDLRQQFSGNALKLPVAGLENRIVYAVRDPGPALDMAANMERAMQLSEELNIELMPILSVIYNTNPVGQGLI